MSYISDFITAAKVESAATQSEVNLARELGEAFRAEEMAKKDIGTRNKRFWARRAKKSQARAAACNNRAKNLRSLLGRKLNKLKNK